MTGASLFLESGAKVLHLGGRIVRVFRTFIDVELKYL